MATSIEAVSHKEEQDEEGEEEKLDTQISSDTLNQRTLLCNTLECGIKKEEQFISEHMSNPLDVIPQSFMLINDVKEEQNASFDINITSLGQTSDDPQENESNNKCQTDVVQAIEIIPKTEADVDSFSNEIIACQKNNAAPKAFGKCMKASQLSEETKSLNQIKPFNGGKKTFLKIGNILISISDLSKFPQGNGIHKNKIDDNVSKNGKGILRCINCNKTYTDKHDCAVVTDKNLIPLKCFSCQVCNLKCYGLKNFQAHMLTHTDKLPIYEKHTLVLKKKNDVTNHLTSDHIMKPFACHFCLIRFDTLGELQKHLTMHKTATNVPNNTSKTILICKICDKIFVTKKALQEHFNTHNKNYEKVIKIDTGSHKPEKKANTRGTFTSMKDLLHHNTSVVHKTVIDLECKVCHKTFSQLRSLRDHAVVHTGKNHKCEICGKAFYRPRDVEKHMRVHDKSKQKHTCDICKKGFPSEKRLKSHMKCLPSKTSLQDHLLTEHKAKQFECNICNKKFAHPHTLEAHLERHSGEKKYKCEICEKAFYQLHSVKVHMRVHTGQIGPFSCKLCDAKFPTEMRLKRHAKVHESNKKFNKCKYCGDNFSNPVELKEHFQAHIAARNFSCSICGKSFAVFTSLYRHKRIHSNIKIQCSICYATFSTPEGLKKHLPIHESYKRPQCKICGKTFARCAALTRHMYIHTKANKYACEICPKKFVREENLKEHLKVHNEGNDEEKSKPYLSARKYFNQGRTICEVCGKSVLKYYIKSHMNSHTGERAFECKICHKRYRQNTGLYIHNQAVHVKKRYNCDICGKAFAFMALLRAHMTYHTGEKAYKCEICDRQFACARYLVRHKAVHREKELSCNVCFKSFRRIDNLRAHLLTHNKNKK